MKKILLIFASVGLLLATVASCDSEPKNPGDFSVKAELSLSDIISLKTGETYPLIVERQFDSIYQRKIGYKDTVFAADGSIESIKNDTVIVPAKSVAKIVKMEPVYLPYQADTFRIDITSNARWNAPAPTTTGNWYSAIENTTGGGDSYMTFRSIANITTMRTANLRVYTSDSSVMYIVPLIQRGLRDK